MRWAATASRPACNRAPRAPESRSIPAASCEVSRSSTISVRTPKRPCRRCAKRRASLPTGCSLPSACEGHPTTSSAGRHSAINRSIAANRARVSATAMVARGCASRISKSPTAMPMRLVPKSNARTVPVLGRGERGEERGVFRLLRGGEPKTRFDASLLSPRASRGVRRGRPARTGSRNRCRAGSSPRTAAFRRAGRRSRRGWPVP